MEEHHGRTSHVAVWFERASRPATMASSPRATSRCTSAPSAPGWWSGPVPSYATGICGSTPPRLTARSPTPCRPDLGRDRREGERLVDLVASLIAAREHASRGASALMDGTSTAASTRRPRSCRCALHDLNDDRKDDGDKCCHPDVRTEDGSSTRSVHAQERELRARVRIALAALGEDVSHDRPPAPASHGRVPRTRRTTCRNRRAGIATRGADRDRAGALASGGLRGPAPVPCLHRAAGPPRPARAAGRMELAGMVVRQHRAPRRARQPARPGDESAIVDGLAAEVHRWVEGAPDGSPSSRRSCRAPPTPGWWYACSDGAWSTAPRRSRDGLTQFTVRAVLGLRVTGTSNAATREDQVFELDGLLRVPSVLTQRPDLQTDVPETPEIQVARWTADAAHAASRLRPTVPDFRTVDDPGPVTAQGEHLASPELIPMAAAAAIRELTSLPERRRRTRWYIGWPRPGARPSCGP